MSKSYNNAIFLSDPPETVLSKVGQMITDPQRARRSDPGNPDVCNVFTFHQLYSDEQTVQRVNTECREAKIGCVECKKLMGENLVKALAPIREKRIEYEQQHDLVMDIMEAGNRKAREIARQTMEEVRQAVKI